MTAAAVALPLPSQPGLAMEGTPSMRLPGEHFAAALAFLAAGAAGLVWVAPELAAGLYLSPRVAGVTHAFTLGFLTMTIFGALYQLLPVALGVSIRSERWGHVSFWMFAPGVALFIAGVASSVAALRHAGAALLVAGTACLIVNVAGSLRRATQHDVIRTAIAIALTFLAATLVLGLTLVVNLRSGFLAEHRVRVLAVHLHVALIGWVLVMIIGISQRLLPMFLLAHGVDARWTRRAIALAPSGVVALAAGLLCGFSSTHRSIQAVLTWTGVALIAAGVAAFLVQCGRFFRARLRRRLDAGLRHVALSIACIAVAAALGPIVMHLGRAHPRLDVDYVMLGLLGLVLYAVGQLYKIVPFLAWISRFRHEMGRQPVPTVAELYSADVAHGGLAAFAMAMALLPAGVALGAPAMVRGGALLFAAGCAALISQMIRVVYARARR